MSDPVKKLDCPVRVDYTISAGTAQTRFLWGMADGKIMGQRCPQCRKVYVPPRGACPACGVATDEEVECGDTGTITTFCIVNLPFSARAQEIPYVCASILLDGADIPAYFLIQEIPADQVRMGMRVEAVWEGERKPTQDSIKYFKPTGEPDAPFEAYKDHI